MKRNNVKILLTIILSVGIIQQCRPQPEIPPSLDGMLLYLEDLDGTGGNASGNFSDIVAFDPVSQKQYILTSDAYYDDYPTYSAKTRKVYFESKREDYHPAVGLTAKSHIYELDLTTKKILLVDNEKFRKILLLKDWQELTQPLISHNGIKLLFSYFGNTLNRINYKLTLYYLKLDSILVVDRIIYFPSRYIFSKNDSIIVFDSQTSGKIKNRTDYIALYNIHTKEKKILIMEKDKEKELGDYKYGKIVFTSKRWDEDVSNAVIFVYDISKKENIRIAGVKELGFREIKFPVFKNENSIYFIGSKESKKPDTFDEDIYLLNLQTKEMKQITFTHNIKDNLRHYNE